MHRNEKIMAHLCTIAQDVTPVGNARLAAAIVHKRQIVGLGVNQRKSHTLQKRYGRNEDSVYLHAEVSAIRNAVNRMGGIDFLRHSTLIVARMRVIDGKWVRGLAEPCSGCYKAVEAFGIERVLWTGDE